MGNCLSAKTNKRNGLHKLEASLECKSTQTDKYTEDKSGENVEKVSKDNCMSKYNQHRRYIGENMLYIYMLLQTWFFSLFY